MLSLALTSKLSVRIPPTEFCEELLRSAQPVLRQITKRQPPKKTAFTFLNLNSYDSIVNCLTLCDSFGLLGPLLVKQTSNRFYSSVFVAATYLNTTSWVWVMITSMYDLTVTYVDCYVATVAD